MRYDDKSIYGDIEGLYDEHETEKNNKKKAYKTIAKKERNKRRYYEITKKE